MADKFPGPYINTIPQNVDAPDPMIRRVRFSSTDIGSRSSALPKNIKNDMTVRHVGDMNKK